MNSNQTEYKIGDEVTGIVDRLSPMGVNVLLDNDTEGLLYENEIFRRLFKGESIKAYIKDIRSDGKITLSLQPAGYKNFINSTTELILNALEKNGGHLPLNDKSNPEDIYYQFQISKKRFKEAIGALYKARKIEITEDGIKLKL